MKKPDSSGGGEVHFTLPGLLERSECATYARYHCLQFLFRLIEVYSMGIFFTHASSGQLYSSESANVDMTYVYHQVTSNPQF